MSNGGNGSQSQRFGMGGGGEEEGGKEKGRRGGAAGLLRGDGRWGAGFFQLILHALTFAIDGDGFCVVEESIEDC